MTEGIRVPLAELETSEDDIYVNAKYRGRPFTGVAFDDSGGEYAEYSYLDGAAHGRSFSRFAGGKLADDEVWDHGKLVSGTYWWPPGDAVRLQLSPEGSQYFYQDGALGIAQTTDAERRYDPSGVLRQERLYRAGGQDFTYYGPGRRLGHQRPSGRRQSAGPGLPAIPRGLYPRPLRGAAGRPGLPPVFPPLAAGAAQAAPLRPLPPLQGHPEP